MSLLANVNQPNTIDYYFELVNSSAVQASNWSTFPAKHTVNVSGNAISGASVLGLDGQLLTADVNNLYLNGSAIATINNSVSSVANWALFPAVQDVNMSNHNISSVRDITLSGVLRFPSGSTTMSASGNACIVNGNDIVSRWASYEASQLVDLSGQNMSNVNNITFNLAVPLPVVGNATINNLNSLNFSLLTAGVGQAGLNNVNNIAFWNPNVPGVPGFYANMFSSNLTYRGLGDVYIATDTKFSVPALFTSSIPGQAGGKIECRGDAATYLLANGSPCPAVWSEFEATQSVELNGNQILGCGSIDLAFQPGVGPFNLLSIDNEGNFTIDSGIVYGGQRGDAAQWSAYTALNTVDMNNNDLSNVSQIIFNLPENILTTDIDNNLTYKGQVVQTGGGEVANWAQYPANHDVDIPSPHAFNINGANDTVINPDATINANIYHGVATFDSLVQPDFVSYPNVFSVGSAVPGYQALNVDLNGGTEGVTIYSVTGVGILADVDVDITAGGLLTLEAAGDINMTSAAITVETGGINVTAGAVNVECAEMAVVSAGLYNVTSSTVLVETGAMTVTAGATNIGCAELGIASAGGVVITGGTTSIAVGATTVATGNFNLTSAAAQIAATDGLDITTGSNDTTIRGGTLAVSTDAMQVNCPITVDTIQPATGTTLTLSATTIQNSQTYSLVVPPPLILTAGTLALSPSNYGGTIIYTTPGRVNFTTAGLARSNAGWFMNVRNASVSNIPVEANGSSIAGLTSTLHGYTSNANSFSVVIQWDGTTLTMY